MSNEEKIISMLEAQAAVLDKHTEILAKHSEILESHSQTLDTLVVKVGRLDEGVGKLEAKVDRLTTKSETVALEVAETKFHVVTMENEHKQNLKVLHDAYNLMFDVTGAVRTDITKIEHRVERQEFNLNWLDSNVVKKSS